MIITPFGAAGGEVTGSAYLVETDRARALVDCGLFQGGARADAKNRALPPALAKLDAVLVTHAHLDHTGRLPLLAKGGYGGPVFATPATAELAGLILRDSATIQAGDTERLNKKLRRAGREPVAPLYSAADVEAISGRFRPVKYREPVAVAPGLEARFFEAGHMLGSTSIHLIAGGGDGGRSAVFSGDLGPRQAPILRDYELMPQADAVFMEATYGDRDHRPLGETIDEFYAIVGEMVAARGKILVPTFAVGRAQLLLTLLAAAFRGGHLPRFPIYLDSPMAIEASRIYLRHHELFDDELREFIRERPLQEDLATLHLSVTAEESKRLNELAGPCLIMAGAGMCNAGRILHHLKQNLWKPSTRVIIVGYQAHGSLGRRLVEGVKAVRIHGEVVAVKGKIHTLGGFSAHAGQTDLGHWFDALAPGRPRLLLTHGEDRAREALAAAIRARHRLAAELPAEGDRIEV